MHTDFAESADLTITNNGLRERIIQRLTHVWRQQRVETIFQNIFLESLREASISQLSEMASAEADLATGRQSFAFSLQQLTQARGEVLQQLVLDIQELERKENKTERDIDQVCRQLKELREANLQTAQLLLDIDRYFREALRQNCYSPSLAKEMNKLDQDNDFLRKSLLRKFILFSKSYDPFMLKHEEALRATQNPRLREVRSVETLFTLPISYIYRLEKAQKGCVEYMARGSPILTANLPRDRVKNYRIISPIRDNLKLNKKNRYHTTPKQELMDEIDMTSAKLDDELNSFRLDKDIYLSNRNHIDTPVTDYERVLRKGSAEEYLNSSPSTRIRNSSVRINKDPNQLLPRLNTIHSISSNKDSKITKETSSFTKRYNVYQSINQMQERDKELRSLILPKKFEKLEVKNIFTPSSNRETQVSKYPPREQRKEISVQCDPKQINKVSPPSREESIQTVQDRPVNSVIAKKQRAPTPPSSIDNKRNKYKKYQLKAAKIPIEKFFEGFKEIDFNPSYSRIFEIGSWQNSIRHNQYYFHKFFVNQQLSAVSLSCALPEGDILIKCWGPLRCCDGEMSNFLFGKYIEHIQKTTFCSTIFYNNLPVDQLQQHHFERKKERIYQRQRVYPSLCQKGDYSPFLALDFSSIAISKQELNQEKLLIKSTTIQDYHPSKFICFNYLLIINKLVQSGSFSSAAAYHPRLSSLREANLKIISQSLSPQAYNTNFRCKYCHLLTLRLRNPIKYAFFIADRGFIKTFGQVVDETEDSIIVCLPLLRYNTKIFFGKGIKNAAEMSLRCKRPPREKPERINFSVHMFHKRLRGKLQSVNLKEENTYADFDFTFSWRDFLKGNIEHQITECDELFDSTFYCLLEMEKELLFVFEVSPTDFIQ